MEHFPKVPKIRQAAEIVFDSGDVMKGYVFIEATLRIQDVLNGQNSFFPFVDDEEQIHLINKFSICRVVPRE